MKRLLFVAVPVAIALITVLNLTVISQKTPEKPIYIAQTASFPATKTLNADTIFELVNTERLKAGVKPLVRDARLDKSAQAKVNDMATEDYFDHVDPVTGLHGYEYIEIINDCEYVGENIGMTNGLPDNNAKQLEWWMNSKPHHDAMLNAEYEITGVAVNGSKVVQHFCNLN